MIPKEYEYFLCISLWFVFILRSLVSYILTMMSLKSQKKTFIYAWKVQNVKILWEYVPCITSSLEVMQCTPIGMASLVISRKWFPFRFCFVSSSEICMSRSYDFSLPLISFSIYSIDCIPDSISFLELWALDCKEFHEFEGSVWTWLHYWPGNTEHVISRVVSSLLYSHMNDETILLACKEI